jgi:DNA-binding NtrC family response regulator
VGETLAPPPSSDSADERPTEPNEAAVSISRIVPAGSHPLDRFISDEVTLDDLDRRYMEAVLEHCGWNKSQAARLLGIERTTLDRRLKRYHLSRPDAE